MTTEGEFAPFRGRAHNRTGQAGIIMISLGTEELVETVRDRGAPGFALGPVPGRSFRAPEGTT